MQELTECSLWVSAEMALISPEVQVLVYLATKTQMCMYLMRVGHFATSTLHLFAGQLRTVANPRGDFFGADFFSSGGANPPGVL